ncbi:MAG: hypothetical protein HY738_15180 [Bacteroidia bacterium]|nr:hypothetical protein [Bacteroidia bacterium]
MNNKIAYTIIIFLLFCTQLFAQTKAKIINIDFNPIGDNIVITYDIVNYTPEETFGITIGIFTESGKKLNAFSLSGDIGENIKGGVGKKILWNVIKDNIVLDEGIYVEFDAPKFSLPAITTVKTPELPALPEKPGKQISGIKAGKAIFLSTIYPGWGNSKVTGKKGNLVIGVLAYGSLASAFIFNNMSKNNYNDYLDTYTLTERENYYKTAARNKNVSGALFITAGVVWVTDIVLTAVQSKNNKNNRTTACNTRLSVTGTFDHKTVAPVIGIKYNF